MLSLVNYKKDLYRVFILLVCMKLFWLFLLSFMFLMILIVSGCTQQDSGLSESSEAAVLNDDSSGNADVAVVSSGSKAEPKKLTEFQVEACNAADRAGTCDTRLKELAIVSRADCCASLLMCC